MKHSAVAIICLLLIPAASRDAQSHGVAKVRKELSEQGYVDLEFQRTRPPFKLDACKDGTIYHLHVDFYGKITEKTAIGDCDSDHGTATADDPDTSEDEADGEGTGITDQARSRAWRYWGNDYIDREEGN